MTTRILLNKKIHILLDWGGYSFSNLGDIAMLQVAIKRIERTYPHSEIYIFTDCERDLNFFCPNSKAVSPTWRDNWLNEKLIPIPYRIIPPRYRDTYKKKCEEFKFSRPGLSTGLLAFSSLFSNPRRFMEFIHFYKLMRSIECVITCGGGFITDSFASHADNVLETLFLAHRMGKPTAMFGQGLGPITRKSLLENTKRTLPRLNALGIRENLISKQIASINLVSGDKLFVTGDDAIEIALNKTGPPEEGCFGLNFRQAAYAGDIKHVFSIIGNIITSIAQSENRKVIPVPIHIGDEYRDLRIIAENCSIDAEEFKLAKNISTPDMLVKQIQRCSIVISGSYHAAVFALAQGIPVIALAASDYYLAKFEGLKEQFKVGCEIINLVSDQFPEQLEQTVKSSLKIPRQSKDQLVKAAKMQTKFSQAAWRKFLEGSLLFEKSQ
jgi:colanic acid/amylovoran biosynthesis protein